MENLETGNCRTQMGTFYATLLKNAAMTRAEPTPPVLKNKKCGHVKSGTHIPCPQKQ